MAPIITDPKKLSMPQQVQKNKDDIAEIKKVIDGLDSLDNVVIVPDMSHIMTAEELKSVRQPVCFIIYDNHIYIKKKEESGNAYFDVVFSIVATTVISFQSSEIEVNLSNGALGIVNSTVSTYSSAKVDELLALKASYTYVDTELAEKANLAGANFTGGITAPSIIETMSGYRFQEAYGTSAGVHFVYCGISKTGNKLTIVQALTLTGSELQSGNLRFGRFYVPASIEEKIFSLPDDEYNLFAATLVPIYEKGSYSSEAYTKSVFASIARSDKYIQLGMNGFSSGSYDWSKDYFLRIELTILLSDNLAP